MELLDGISVVCMCCLASRPNTELDSILVFHSVEAYSHLLVLDCFKSHINHIIVGKHGYFMLCGGFIDFSVTQHFRSSPFLSLPVSSKPVSDLERFHKTFFSITHNLPPQSVTAAVS